LYQNQIDENLILFENENSQTVDDEYIEEVLQNQLDDDYEVLEEQDYLNQEEEEEENNQQQNSSEEPKLTKINIEFINRFKKYPKHKKHKQKKNNETITTTIEQKGVKTPDCETKSLDTLILVNSSSNKQQHHHHHHQEKKKHKKKKNKLKIISDDLFSSSSAASFSTSTKSENKTTTIPYEKTTPQNKQELNLNNNNNKINSNLNNNEQTTILSSKNNKQIELLFENQINNSEKSIAYSPTTTATSLSTTINSNFNLNEIEQSKDLNNSLSNNNNNNNFENKKNSENNNIKHVFEKTKLLVRNFYRNFDLLKETQDLSEQFVSSKMFSSTDASKNIKQQQQQSILNNKNNLLTNSTSNILVNNTINCTTTLTPSTTIQQPHWVNIATMGSSSNNNYNKLNNKVFGSNDSSIYLYSEMPVINTNNKNLNGNKKFNRNNYKNVEETLAVSPVRTIAASMKHTTNNNSSNKQIILLKRDKAGKLIPIEATTTTSFKQQQQHIHQIKAMNEEVFLAENNDIINNDLVSHLNLNEYLKLPNLVKTKLTIEQLNKQANNNSNRESSYVLTQMAKYQRQNAINFLKLTNKTSTLDNNINTPFTNTTSLLTSNSSSLSTNINNIKTPEQIKCPTPPPSAPSPPNTAPIINNHYPILVRGNSFAAKDISNHLINQQHQINSLIGSSPNCLNKPKLSQIKLRAKNRPIYISSISDFNMINNDNTNTTTTTTTTTNNNDIETLSINNDDSVANLSSNEEIKNNEIKEEEQQQQKLEEIKCNKKIEPIREPTKIALVDTEPTLNKCRGLYTYAATSSSQLKETGLISTNNNRSTSINYHNYNTEAFHSSSMREIIESLSQKIQQEITTKSTKSNEIITPIKIKNNSNNRQIFKDLEFIYNEQQVIKLKRQILIQIRQQNKLANSKLEQNFQLAGQRIEEDEDAGGEEENDYSLRINKPHFENNNRNYNYDYDVYKFYERNKTTLLLSSLQQSNRSNKMIHSNNNNNNNNNNKQLIVNEINQDLNDNEDILDRIDEKNLVLDEETDSFDNNNNNSNNLISKRVKCEN
jgi:hypothetical protein